MLRKTVTKQEKNRHRLLQSVIILALLIVLFQWQQNLCVPLLNQAAAFQCEKLCYNTLVQSTQRAAEQAEIQAAELYTAAVQGQTLVLQANAAAIQQAQLRLTAAMQQILDEKLSRCTVTVPLGCWTGIGALNGWGPLLSVDTHVDGYLTSEIRPQILQAGINTVSVDFVVTYRLCVFCYLAQDCQKIQAEYNALLGEVILNGTVPNTYWQK